MFAGCDFSKATKIVKAKARPRERRIDSGQLHLRMSSQGRKKNRSISDRREEEDEKVGEWLIVAMLFGFSAEWPIFANY